MIGRMIVGDDAGRRRAIVEGVGWAILRVVVRFRAARIAIPAYSVSPFLVSFRRLHRGEGANRLEPEHRGERRAERGRSQLAALVGRARRASSRCPATASRPRRARRRSARSRAPRAGTSEPHQDPPGAAAGAAARIASVRTPKSTWWAYSCWTTPQEKRPVSRRPAVEPDLAGDGMRGDAPADVDHDPARDEAPVEAARVERRSHLAPLGARAAVEDVAAARSLRRRREHEREEKEKEKAQQHALDVVRTARRRMRTAEDNRCRGAERSTDPERTQRAKRRRAVERLRQSTAARSHEAAI